MININTLFKLYMYILKLCLPCPLKVINFYLQDVGETYRSNNKLG